jgi:hypothetical protein
MPTLNAYQIGENFFDRNVRISCILPLVSLVHSESLTDPWEDLLRDPSVDFSKILKTRFGIDEKKYKTEGALADAIMRKNDTGYIVCYEIPVITSVHGPKGAEARGHSGFGYSQMCYLYLPKVDDEGLEAVLTDARRTSDDMVAALRAKAARADKKKKTAKV